MPFDNNIFNFKEKWCFWKEETLIGVSNNTCWLENVYIIHFLLLLCSYMTLIAFRGHLFVVLRLFIFLRVMNLWNKKVTFLRHVSKYGPNIVLIYMFYLLTFLKRYYFLIVTKMAENKNNMLLWKDKICLMFNCLKTNYL